MEDEEPDFGEIARALGDSVANLTGKEQFFGTLEDELSSVNGASVDGYDLVTDRADEDEVFDAIFATIEREAQLVPPEHILEVHGEYVLDDIPGGQRLVDRYL